MITKDRAEKFIQLVQGFTDDVSIFITQYDPDAQASALVLKKIMEKFLPEDLKVLVYYDEVYQRQNKKLLDSYGLDSYMRKFSSVELQEFKNIALVDASRLQDGRISLESSNLPEPVIIFDHHKKADVEETENQFYQIEPVAACCTLLIELAEILNIDLFASEEIPLADLLVIGIYTDTKSLLNTHERDEEAYFTAIKHADRTNIKQVLRVKYPLSFLDSTAFALNNVEYDKGVLVTGVGIVNPSDADFISTVNDREFTCLENITISIVWGIIRNKMRVSARSSGDTSLEEYLKEKIGDQSGAKVFKDLTAEGGGIIDFDMGDLGQFMQNNKRVEEEFVNFAIKFMREVFLGQGIVAQK
jgi:nanoRNase/pAp phosphatase (c-di-AMP/oligoRNAs hydrolase)